MHRVLHAAAARVRLSDRVPGQRAFLSRLDRTLTPRVEYFRGLETAALKVRILVRGKAIEQAVGLVFCEEDLLANGIDCIGVSWGFGSHAELIEAGAQTVANTPAEVVAAVAGTYRSGQR